MFIDVDPDRASGISSSEPEREAALSVLNNCTSYLAEQTWPAPITALSGNGYYALYKIDLPNDAESLALVTAVLAALAERFNTAAAHIDTGVFNASRIIGLVGTKKMKGDSLPERPHRYSKLLSVPEQIGTVSEAQLRAIVPQTEVARELVHAAQKSGPTGRLTDLLDAAGIEHRAQPPDANGVTWYHVTRCPFHEDGHDFECGVGQKLPDGHYAGHGFHPECSDKAWSEWKAALGLGGKRTAPVSSSAVAVQGRTTDFAKTDSGNAELFTQLYGDRVRFNHRRGRWLLWGEHHWTEDPDGTVHRLAKEAVRQRYLAATALDNLEDRAAQAKFAVVSENRQRLEALLALARNQLPISDRGDAWDRNPWLLGVGNGVLDLRTGALIDGEPDQRITKVVDVRFDPQATCPRWLRFLDEVFNGDQETIDFIWRAIGYSLAGDTSEQCVFACYGTGSNGKSVLLSVIRKLAGAYAYNAPFSVFELQNRGNIPNDVAALAGARLVTSSETNEGTRLNEGRLKALTGNDPITARFLNREFFTFYAEAKYWLAVNHRPRVDDQSFGFWRRVRLIPFLRTFDADRDSGLESKLVRELPGILAWAVRGCLAWQDQGLGLPDTVATATEAYRQDSDPLAQFLDDCCVIRPDARCGATEAYLAYVAWATQRAMKESEKLSSTLFGTKLGERFQKKRSGRGVFYVGFGLRSEHSADLADPAPVQGLVQSLESDVGSPLVFPLTDSLTREEQRVPCTTLHPTHQPSESAGESTTCSECSALAAVGSSLCEAHLRGLAFVALDRKRWPRLTLSDGCTVVGDDAWRPWLREAKSELLLEVLAALGLTYA